MLPHFIFYTLSNTFALEYEYLNSAIKVSSISLKRVTIISSYISIPSYVSKHTKALFSKSSSKLKSLHFNKNYGHTRTSKVENICQYIS